MILFILNEFRIKPYLEMWGNERDWDRVEIVSLTHTPTSLYLTLCIRKVFFPKQQKPTQKPTPAWEIFCVVLNDFFGHRYLTESTFEYSKKGPFL